MPEPLLCRICDTPLKHDMGGTFCPYCGGLHEVTDHNGFTRYRGDLNDCKRELQHLIDDNPLAYFQLCDPLGEVVEQGGNREML